MYLFVIFLVVNFFNWFLSNLFWVLFFVFQDYFDWLFRCLNFILRLWDNFIRHFGYLLFLIRCFLRFALELFLTRLCCVLVSGGSRASLSGWFDIWPIIESILMLPWCVPPSVGRLFLFVLAGHCGYLILKIGERRIWRIIGFMDVQICGFHTSMSV